jgi:solute carrier family 25 carnitine/acylcarnitine transporter 20/29
MRGVFDKHTNHTMSALAAGSFAGTMSWGVVYPCDVIKTEIQAGTGGTTSISQVCKNLYKESGYKAFFRGIGPTLVRAVPVNGITFLCYEKMKMSMEF